MIELRVSRILGKKEIIDNITRVYDNIESSLVRVLSNASDELRDQAIQNVLERAKEPGSSYQGGSITDRARWVVEPIDYNSINLLCTSEHAAIVEFGGEMGTVLVTMPTGPGYPIGAQQNEGTAKIGDDGKPIIRRSFVIQQPMSYFRTAMDQSANNMMNVIKSDIETIIENTL